jgi:cold shock CspA family protein
MRIEGTRAKWNDDRGFGFIAPVQGGPEVFVHISAFPKDGQRPRLGERLSFESETTRDGKNRAREVRRLDRLDASRTRPPEPGRRRPPEPGRRRGRRGALSRAVPLLIVVVLGTYVYTRYDHRPTSYAPVAVPPPNEVVEESASRFSCDGRTRSREMTSCEEASYFLQKLPECGHGRRRRRRAVRGPVVLPRSLGVSDAPRTARPPGTLPVPARGAALSSGHADTRPKPRL